MSDELLSSLFRRYRALMVCFCICLFLVCSWRFVQVSSASRAVVRSLDGWRHELDATWRAHEGVSVGAAKKESSSSQKNTEGAVVVEASASEKEALERSIKSQESAVKMLVSKLDDRISAAKRSLSSGWQSAETHFRLFHSRNWWPLKRINLPVSVTTRKTTWKSLREMALFKTFLPSLLQTMEDGYQYGVYLGFDAGDPLLDRPGALQQMVDLWNGGGGSAIELKMFRYNDTENHNVWAVNYITKEAYLDGYDYFFRVNDDSEFKALKWTSTLVEALQRNDDFGAVGVLDKDNPRIWTHSFVARQHLEIFGFHFPFSFGNYWSDDWITLAYDSSFSIWLYDVPIHHHLFSERYSVDWKAKERLGIEVERARLRWRTWLCRAKGASEFCDHQVLKNQSASAESRGGYNRTTLMKMENLAKEEQFKRMALVKKKLEKKPKKIKFKLKI